MEDVLGGRTDPKLFSAFLLDWESILELRVEEAVTAFRDVTGVHGLVLAGSMGRGAPWPLSDIDFLVIYDDDRRDEAAAEIEQRRIPILARWIAEGWAAYSQHRPTLRVRVLNKLA